MSLTTPNNTAPGETEYPSNKFAPFDGTIQESKKSNLPKVNDHVKIRLKDSDDLINGKILSCGGKSTGKYSSWFNVKNSDTNDQICIDFKNHVNDIFKSNYKLDLENLKNKDLKNQEK